MQSPKNQVEILLKSYEVCVENLYFYYMTRECDCEDCENRKSEIHPPLDLFRVQMLAIANDKIDDLHSKYADHIEGIQRTHP